MDRTEYLEFIAAQLVHELTPVLSVKGVTANTELLGMYTEALVAHLVRRIVHPMHVSSGAVIDHPMPDPLRQIDLIVWAPFPAPAVFDVGGFALVPKSSAFGVVEVKRSNHSGVESSLEAFLDDARNHRIVSSPVRQPADFGRLAGIGVVSVLESKPSQRLQRLLDKEEVVAIFERAKGSVHVRSHDVMVLVNFLHFLTWRYRAQSAEGTYPQIRVGK